VSFENTYKASEVLARYKKKGP